MRRAEETSDNLRVAIGAILLTVFALSLGDALIKALSASFQLWQLFLIRSAIALPPLLLLAKLCRPGISLRPKRLGWTALRSLMLAVMWVAYYAALPRVDLAVAAAVYYTLPLFMTLLAALLIGERAGLRGWLAVGLGFIGVLLILKPQAAGFNAYAALPLLSALLYALAMILTRSKLKAEDPLVLSLSLNVAFIALGGLASLLLWAFQPSQEAAAADPFMLGSWASLGGTDWLAAVLLAVAVMVGSVFAAIAYQSGPASTVATFDFAYLAFAALWGVLFFAEVPDTAAALGICMIACAGLLSVRR